MLHLTLEHLTAVSLLKSDRWLTYFASSELHSPEDARKIGFQAVRDYQFYHSSPFRKEDCIHALHRWVDFDAPDWDILSCLARLKKEFLFWQGDCYVAKPEKLELWLALISKIDPVWILAFGYAHMLHQGMIRFEQILNSGHQQCGFALRKDHRQKEYADNHVHLGGHGDYSLALVEYALAGRKTDADYVWPPMPECTAYESGMRNKNELPRLVRWFCDYQLNQMFNCKADRSWIENEHLLNIHPSSEVIDYIKENSHDTVPELLIKASLDEKYSAQHRWLMLATGLIYEDILCAKRPPSIPPDCQRHSALRAFIHSCNIFRSAMIVNGVGLGEFVEHFGFKHRKGTGRSPYKKHSQKTDVDSNIYREFKISPGVVDDKWLKDEATRLIKISRENHKHYAIHFPRSLKNNKDRRDKLQKNFRDKLHKSLHTLHGILGRFSLQECTIENKSLEDETTKTANVKRLIRGIDVAGNENDLPIEIFAPTIRALRGRNHSERSALLHPERKMHLTIHAGEDYSHIVSGLRAIDETITFCDYQHGDRIGHGLALGVDVDNWVQRQQRVYITAGELLDNLVWMHHMAHSVVNFLPELAGVINILERKIAKYSSHIWYAEQTPSDLYHAWMLRRNCPRAMFYGKIDIEAPLPDEDERHEELLLMPDLQFIRNNYNEKICSLWLDYVYSYQFEENINGMNDSVCIDLTETPAHHLFNGEKHLSDTISKAELELISAIQDMLIQRYSQMGITMEACPTSNIYIGRLDSYEEHPLFRWYPPDISLLNPGKKYNKFGLRSGPLSVCINTDDAGLMPTTIQNEHRVIKETAIKHFNISGEMAELWIDRIRQIGVDAFHRNHLPL